MMGFFAPIQRMLRLGRQRTSSAIRLKCTRDWSGNICGHCKVINTKIWNWITDHNSSVLVYDRHYITQISSRNTCSNGIPNRRRCVNFHTDGSKSRGRMGFLVYARELRLPNYCSVFLSEILEINEAVDWLRLFASNIYTDIHTMALKLNS